MVLWVLCIVVDRIEKAGLVMGRQGRLVVLTEGQLGAAAVATCQSTDPTRPAAKGQISTECALGELDYR